MNLQSAPSPLCLLHYITLSKHKQLNLLLTWRAASSLPNSCVNSSIFLAATSPNSFHLVPHPEVGFEHPVSVLSSTHSQSVCHSSRSSSGVVRNVGPGSSIKAINIHGKTFS